MRVGQHEHDNGYNDHARDLILCGYALRFAQTPHRPA
jgi:hypothetical protein